MSRRLNCSPSAQTIIWLWLWRVRQATAYMRGQRCPKEMRNSTRLRIRRDPSLPRDSWQLTGAPLRGGCRCPHYRIVNRCQTIDVDGCRQTVKLQSVLRLCSGFYRSKNPTNSIKVLLILVLYLTSDIQSYSWPDWVCPSCYSTKVFSAQVHTTFKIYTHTVWSHETICGQSVEAQMQLQPLDFNSKIN